jgi:hypothetical protein
VWVADERHGRWHKAIPVPGLAGKYTDVDSVSCAPAGSCAVGGGYKKAAFVAVERDGRWHKAFPQSGLAALGNAEETFASVGCGSPASYAAGGHYVYRRGHYAAFVTQAR